jgi:hypothetical protein
MTFSSLVVPHATTASAAVVQNKMATLLLLRECNVFYGFKKKRLLHKFRKHFVHIAKVYVCNSHFVESRNRRNTWPDTRI